MNKVKTKVIGKDGNVFVILGICSDALIEAGKEVESDEMTDRVFSSGSYKEALSIMKEYCEFVK